MEESLRELELLRSESLRREELLRAEMDERDAKFDAWRLEREQCCAREYQYAKECKKRPSAAALRAMDAADARAWRRTMYSEPQEYHFPGALLQAGFWMLAGLPMDGGDD